MTAEVFAQSLPKRKGGVPGTTVLVMEYPSFEGIVPPFQTFQECWKAAQASNIHVHVDGARLFLGLAESGIEPKELMKYCSSLTFCLTKCLLAPIGSIVVGSKDFIHRFKLNRKMLGGELRKPGLMAGTGLIALKKVRIQEGFVGREHKMAQLLGERLKQFDWIELVGEVKTNMVWCRLRDPTLNIEDLAEFMKKRGVLMWTSLRFVVHRHIGESQINKIITVMKEWKASLS